MRFETTTLSSVSGSRLPVTEPREASPCALDEMGQT